MCINYLNSIVLMFGIFIVKFSYILDLWYICIKKNFRDIYNIGYIYFIVYIIFFFKIYFYKVYGN